MLVEARMVMSGCLSGSPLWTHISSSYDRMGAAVRRMSKSRMVCMAGISFHRPWEHKAGQCALQFQEHWVGYVHKFSRRPQRWKQNRCVFTEQRKVAPPSPAGRAEATVANVASRESSTFVEKKLLDSYPKVAILKYSASRTLPPVFPRSLALVQMSPVDQAFLLLGFIAVMTSFALFAITMTAIPTLNAVRKAAVSLEKLSDIAREELPGTMAAIRLSGMEISDLTLELNDLSQEISDGVRSSARAVHAAEVGIRRMGTIAASQTLAMIQERASVPVQAVRPAMVSAAAATLHAVAEAQKLFLKLAAHPRVSVWLGQNEMKNLRNLGDAEDTFTISNARDLQDLNQLPSTEDDSSKVPVGSGK